VSPADLHCLIDGAPQSSALVMGGSLGTTLTMWEPQLGLVEQTRLIRFDHRGHGCSPVPAGPYSMADLGRDVLSLLDRLGLERVSYCGLSLGGMVGQWLAVNAPERIDKLILLCTAAHLPPASGWQERAQAVRAAGTPAVVADTVIGRWFTPEFAAANPQLVASHRAMIADTPAEGYASCCEAIATYDVRAGLPGVRAPTLVIAGAQDPSIPPAHGQQIAAAVPGARFELVDPGAHLASVERAAEVNRLIAGFLST
jgi:3-oxoadipate enol-lactonase